MQGERSAVGRNSVSSNRFLQLGSLTMAHVGTENMSGRAESGVLTQCQ